MRMLKKQLCVSVLYSFLSGRASRSDFNAGLQVDLPLHLSLRLECGLVSVPGVAAS